MDLNTDTVYERFVKKIDGDKLQAAQGGLEDSVARVAKKAQIESQIEKLTVKNAEIDNWTGKLRYIRKLRS